jgi:hypothetical protein
LSKVSGGELRGDGTMSSLESTIAWAVGVATVGIIVGACSQGRLKHWILVLLGSAPRNTKSVLLSEIPRGERNWGMLQRLSGLDGSHVQQVGVTSAPAEVFAEDDDADASRNERAAS